MDGRNSPWRIREVPRGVRSREGAEELRRFLSKAQAKEGQGHRFEPTKVVGFARVFPFQGFMDLILEILALRLAKCGVPKRQKSLVMGPTPGIVSRIDISGFQEIEVRDFGGREAELRDIVTRELMKIE
jgi:hypothetical protein